MYATRSTDVVHLAFIAHQSNVINVKNSRLTWVVVVPALRVNAIGAMKCSNARDRCLRLVAFDFRAHDTISQDIRYAEQSSQFNLPELLTNPTRTFRSREAVRVLTIASNVARGITMAVRSMSG